ncbi:MAG: signal peptide peptidase SppA [Ardenticatenales bacterium]|nr:signal peptide peptidase SppA [Ardenticatenales bacterium]
MAMDEQYSATGANGQPIVIQLKNSGQNRTALWAVVGAITGFLLPICACGILGFLGILALGTSTSPALGPVTQISGTGDAVAIVRIEGTITASDNPDDLAGAASARVIADLEAAAADDTVKAIVLRIDSPGGSVTGSAQIYDAIVAIDKPVVVSMASLAASGGYYVSAPADYIIARADSWTGSLGVIMTVYNVEGLIEEVGIDVQNITSGENKALGSYWDELTPEQEAILQALVDEAYQEFVRIIAEGRGLSEDEVRLLADGRIYSGRQALANGLVDELGNFDAAIAKAAALGGITGTPATIEYQRTPSLGDMLLGLSTGLQQSEPDKVLGTLDHLLTPVLEYRYHGPAPN